MMSYTTLIHEYTHAVDYDRFRNEYHNGQIDIEMNEHYPSVYFYSEFHARSNAHYWFLLLNDIEKRNNLFHMEFAAVKEKIDELIEKSNEISAINFYYQLMQFVGVIHSYQRLDYDVTAIDNDLRSLYLALVDLFNGWSEKKFIKLKKLL